MSIGDLQKFLHFGVRLECMSQRKLYFHRKSAILKGIRYSGFLNFFNYKAGGDYHGKNSSNRDTEL